MQKLKIPILAVVGFVTIVIALVIGGANPVEGLQSLFLGAFGSPAGLRETLRNMVPLLILGAGVFLALKAGLFNIGAEGQFLIGALAGTAVALAKPDLFGILLALIAGIVAGGLWALPAGWIKAYRGGHEVITTIMLNSIAGFLTLWFVNGLLKDPNRQSPTTKRIPESAHLFNIIDQPPFRVNISLVIAVIIVLGLWWYLNKTVSGYELKAVGGNPKAATMAGIDTKMVTLKAMVASGMIAGAAGTLQVLAFDKRFFDGLSPGYGFDALGVAILAGSSPWGLLASALAFAGLSQGTTELSLMGVPKGLNGIMLAVLIIVFAAFRYRKEAMNDS